MKITKTKQIVTEEIEVSPGTYYFEDEDLITYKMVLQKQGDDEYSDYKLEIVKNFGNVFGITFRDDCMDKDSVPYQFKNLILGISGKKIEKEEFYKERTEVLNKLSR